MSHLRSATPSDARDLARLAEDTFRATFGSLNTPENMDAHCAASYGEALQSGEICDPAMATVVAEVDGRLIAYAQLRWGHTAPCVCATKPAEIRRFYVERPWQGKGVARDLMAEVLARVRAAGADLVWLGVWEHNPRAIAFYEKMGFRQAGEQIFQLGADLQRDLVFVRDPGRP